MISEIWSTTDRILSYFGPFFVLLHRLPLNNPKNQNFEKNEKKKKKHLEISSFYTSAP